MPLTTPPYYNAPAKPRNWTKIILLTLTAIIIVAIAGYFIINNSSLFKKALPADENVSNEIDNLFNNDYDCSADVYNCGNFTTQSEAQVVFDSCFNDKGDIHRSDADGNVKACEGLATG